MKAPLNLRDRDPEQYPLASTPTPRALKRLKLDLGGQVTYFEEADEKHDRVSAYHDQQKLLADNNGVLRVEGPQEGGCKHHVSSKFASRSTSQVQGPVVEQGLRNRSATPISATDAAELDSFHRRNSGPRIMLRRSHKHRSRKVIDSETDSSIDENPLTDNRALDLGITGAPQQSSSSTGLGTDPTSSASSFTESDRESPLAPPSCRPQSACPTSLGLDTSPAQDQSLPSPSLSPITSNAALHRPQPLSRSVHQLLGLLDHRVQDTTPSTKLSQQPNLEFEPQQSRSPPAEEDLLASSTSTGTSVEDLPNLLASFDNLPDQMKSYMMYQFLRRCAKPTIRLVAQAIDPALRCDYITRLPVELSLHILGHLDAKSLCRSAQVNKRWRQLVDTHETAWRDLIVNDGFKLTDVEVTRACHEGWGWSITPYITHIRHKEQIQADVLAQQQAESPASDDESQDDFEPGLTETSLRKKRKNLAKPRFSKKGRQDNYRRPLAPSRPKSFFPALVRTKGPTAYVDYARTIVPASVQGLKHLSQLHLFKSIYQRHAIMRANWMDPKSQPLHLAFQAHNRHVVTCLQFDDQKILTGSDDAHIDIYDTKTGRTLNRLSGHEGGVWALEYLDDMLVSGSTDRSIRVWDMRDGRMLHVFQGHTSTVRCLQILQPAKIGEYPDGTPVMMPRQPLIITGSRDSTCRVWRLPKRTDRSVVQAGPPANDTDNPFFLRTLSGHNHSVRAIAAYGDTLISGSYDTFVRVWKISSGECVYRLIGHTSKVYSVVLDYKRRRCISGSMDNMVRVWSIETGTCLFNLDGHTSLVGLLDLRDDFLVSAAADATLRVWNPGNGQCRHVLTSHENAITCFLHDGQKIISGSEKVLKMWNTKTGECVKDLLTRLDGVWQIKFDERRCIAAVQRNGDTYIEVLDFAYCDDMLPEGSRGKRFVLDSHGRRVPDEMVEGYGHGMMLDGQQ